MKKYVLIFITLFICHFANAQDKQESDLDNAAADATNPLAFVTKLQFQPNFSWMDNNARQLSLISRIIQPTPSIGLPFIKSDDPSKVFTIYRLEVPITGQTFPQTPTQSATGINDLTLLNVVAFKQAWGLLGVGSGLIIPTASPDLLGGGKWCAAISGVILNTQTKGLQWGFLVQQFFSFAGESDRQARNFMLIQPIFNKILEGGYFLQVSPIINMDWENKQYNIPISLGLGKAFAKNLTMSLAPQYTIAGPGQGNFTLQLNINTMFPPSKK